MNMFELYKSIFTLTNDDFKLEGLRSYGFRRDTRNHKIYKFIGIVSAKSPVDSFSVSTSEMTDFINYVRRSEKGLGGPDILVPVSWKEEKDGKKIRKSFSFACSLNPMTVFDFDVVNGRFYVKAEFYGTYH